MPNNNSILESDSDLLYINENRYEGISPVHVDNVNDTISIDDNSITSDKMKSGETLPVNISGNANTANTATDYASEGGIAKALNVKLATNGNASDTTSTFTKDSDDTSDMTNGSKLSAIFTAISKFFGTLKSLAFKDKASYDDLSTGVQSSLDKADTALQSSSVDQTYAPLSTNPQSGKAVKQAVSSFIVRGFGSVVTVSKPLTEVWDENHRGLFKLQYAVNDFFGEYFIEIQCKGTITSSNPLGNNGFVKVYSNFTQNLGKDVVRYTIVNDYVVFGFSVNSSERYMCLEVCGHSVSAAEIKNLSDYNFTVMKVNDAFWSVKSKAENTTVGSAARPVYVDSNGHVQPCNFVSFVFGKDTSITPPRAGGMIALLSNIAGQERIVTNALYKNETASVPAFTTKSIVFNNGHIIFMY